VNWQIGVISDTHGLLRESALRALAGVDHIIHAGDVGHPQILVRLSEIAPVTAIRGNIDKGDFAASLPATEVVVFGDSWLYVIHDIKVLDLDPKAGSCRSVISGHTHKPSSEMKDGVLFLNPGSAGPRRFDLPISIALISLSDSDIKATILNLSE